MSRRHLIMLLTLAALWGASFMLIEIGLRDLEPSTLIAARLGLAALTLVAIVPFATGTRAAAAELRRSARPLATLGLLNSALPFFLITWGQQYIDSGVAAILNASAPLFTVLLARAAGHERVSGTRLAGFLLGFGGVALVVGAVPSGGARAIAGSLAVVGAAVCYALSVLYAGSRLAGVSPLHVSLGAMLWATVFALPAGIAQLPAEVPGWKPIVAVSVLGTAATSLAYLLYFGLIANAGPSRAILVTYLVPAAALVYGAAILDEPVRAAALAGLALVLAGVALGTGAVRPGRRLGVPSRA